MAFNPIKFDRILSDDKLNKKMVSQIKIRHTESETFMSKKRKLYKEWYSKYTNPASTETQMIKINMLHQHMKAFISTYYENWLNVGMVGREFLDDDYAYMLETIAKNDYTLMNKKQKDFINMFNVGFYGASLAVKNWYDAVNDVIKYDIFSPDYWLPDVNGNIVKWFKYHMFDFTIGKTEIDNINAIAERNGEDPVYRNIDKYTTVSDWAKQITNNKRTDRGLWWETIDTESYDGTRCFIEREGIKYMIEIFSNQSIIGKFEAIQPVDDVERKNPELIPFPVEVYNAFVLDSDPTGIGLAELVLSFQNAKNRLLNLSLRTEEWNAWFKVLLADISKITDIELLGEKPIDWPIIVPFDWGLWPLNGDVVRPVMDGIRSEQSTLNLANLLDNEAQWQTGYTDINRGIAQSGGTLGQDKMAQVNSNLMFSLDSEVISRGEVNFWKNMWLRWLKEFLPQNKKKYARIGNGIASNEVMISGKDIYEHNDPDIIVESKRSVAEKNKQKLDYMMAREAVIMQNPMIPAISKMFYQRDLEKYRGIPREEIYLKYPRTADENLAIRYIKMINSNVAPMAMFYDGMDLWTYYIYIQKATNNDLKKKILAKLEQMMIDEWLNKLTPPETEWGMSQLTNSMSSQLTSNVAQQSGAVNNYPTRADVLAP